MADAMEVTLLSFISVCAGVEFDLTSTEKASLMSVVFVGELLGGFCWGPFADIYGRRVTFLFGSLLVSVAGFTSAFASSYDALLFFRFVVGVGVGGATIPFDLLAECVPASHRGSYLMYIEYFWSLGTLFVVLVGWLVLASSGWRVLVMITAIPVALSAVLGYFFLPESPHWLLVNGKPVEAEKVCSLCYFGA